MNDSVHQCRRCGLHYRKPDSWMPSVRVQGICPACEAEDDAAVRRDLPEIERRIKRAQEPKV